MLQVAVLVGGSCGVVGWLSSMTSDLSDIITADDHIRPTIIIDITSSSRSLTDMNNIIKMILPQVSKSEY